MRGNQVALIAAACGIQAGTVFATPFSETAAGTPFEAAGARTAAMGGTGATAAEGAAGLFANPAVRLTGSGFRLALTTSLLGDDERRSFPVHDSFSGYLTDNIYALNADHTLYGSGQVAWSGAGDWAPTLFAGWGPVWVADYRYQEQVLSPYRFRSDFPAEIRGDLPDQNAISDFEDLPLGTNRLIQKGGVDAWRVGGAFRLFDRLRLGASLDLLHADIHTTSTISYDSLTVVNQVTGDVWEGKILPYPNQRTETDRTGDALGVTLGARWAVTDHVELNAVYRSPVDFDDAVSVRRFVEGEVDTTEAVSDPLGYPARYVAGVLLHPVNEIRTRLAFQVEIEDWQKDDLPSSSGVRADRVVRWRLGVEHLLPGGTPFRFGMAYGPTYSGSDRSRVNFTAGTGFDAGPVTVDLAGMVGYTAYRTPDLFPDSLYGSPDRTANDRIEERTYRAVATLSWRQP